MRCGFREVVSPGPTARGLYSWSQCGQKVPEALSMERRDWTQASNVLAAV